MSRLPDFSETCVPLSIDKAGKRRRTCNRSVIVMQNDISILNGRVYLIEQPGALLQDALARTSQGSIFERHVHQVLGHPERDPDQYNLGCDLESGLSDA